MWFQFYKEFSFVSRCRHFSPRTKGIPHTFKLQLKTLLLSYPNGIAVEKFLEVHARRFGYYLSFRKWGFSSLEHNMLQLIPDVIQYVRDPAQKTFVKKQVPKVPEVTPSDSASEGGREGTDPWRQLRIKVVGRVDWMKSMMNPLQSAVSCVLMLYSLL